MYDQLKTIPEFEFTDHEGQPFTRQNIRDQWTLWFFGFTHCPDICPMTLSLLSAAVNQLQSEHGVEDVTIVFVSVDPERDTPEKIKAYVNAFNEKAVGVSSYNDNLAPFLQNMGIIAVKQKQTDLQRDYLVDHSSAIYLIAPDTGISALFNTPHRIDSITNDVLVIQDHYPHS